MTPGSARPDDRAVHVAVGAGGLAKLGLPADALASFPLELREGMTTEFRRRILGDIDDNAPEGWRWGGPTAGRSTWCCCCTPATSKG